MSRQDQLDAIQLERSAVESEGQQERQTEGSAVESQSPYQVLSSDTNTISFPNGLQGSLTHLVDGTSYITGGNGIAIASASNGSITISATGEGEAFITGNDGEVQFNGDMNLSGDTNFLYDATSQVLTVTNISGSLTRLVDGTSYIKAGEGVTVVSSSNGSILISKSSQPDISTESWQSYTPIIGDHAQGGSPNIILPTSKTIKGSYIHHSGFMKLIFDLSAPENSGAVAGTGTYTVTLPVGFEIDTSIVSLGSTANLSSGMSIGQASLLSDVVGAGGSWSVVPLTVNKLMLVGKNPASTSIVSWGGENIPVNSGNDLKVSFVATIPVVGSGVSEGLVVATWTSNDAVGTNNSSFLTEGGTLPVQVLDGAVNAIAPDNDGGYYIGGTFTKLVNGFESDRGGFDVITTDQVSSRPFANFNVNGLVHCLVPDGAGGAFIAGTFTSVKGQTRNRIARINSDGTLSDWYPTGGATGGRIVCMHYDTEGGFLYVGGAFTNIGGIARSRIARINVSTAAVDSTWVPTLNGEPFAITSGGGFIYAGGAFTTATPAAGGVAVATQYLTKWNKTTGAVLSMTLTTNTNARVWCLTADATHVYVGGTYVISNGRRLARYLHTETTRDLTWQVLWGSTTADTTTGVTSIKLDNDFVYTTCNFSGTPFTGAPTRAYVAKFRKDSLAVDSWYPVVDAAIYDCAIDAANNRCYFIGDFTIVNSASRRGLAAVTLNNNGTTNIVWDGRTEDRIGAVGDKLEILGGNLWVGTSNASPSWAIARLARVLRSGRIDTSWNPTPTANINALASDSTHLYVGGVNGTIGGLTNRNLVRFAHGIPTADSTWTTSTTAIAGVPRVTGIVYALTLDNENNRVYVGTDGFFNATTQGHIGRLSKTPSGNNAVLQSWNPQVNYVVTTNFVNSIAYYGDKVYFTGNFTSVNSNILRDCFACVSTSTATVDDLVHTTISTNPTTTVKHPVVADSTGAWIATDGYQQHGTLVAISKTPDLRTKDVSNSVTTEYPKITESLRAVGQINIIISDNNGGYFVGGLFSSIQGFPISNLAWIDSNGLVKKNWTPNPNNSVDLGGLHLDGSMLYVTGLFTSIGGSGIAGARIARINITNENATYDSTWTPGSTTTRRILSNYPGIQTDDNYVYVALGENHGDTAVAASTLSPSNVIAGTTVYGICRITKSSPAVATQWISTGTKGSSGDSTYSYLSGVFSIKIVGNVLYASGGFVNIANVNRNRMAAFDLTTGQLLDWNPGGDYWNRGMHYSSPWIYATGGETTWNITPPAGTTSRGSFDVLSLDHTHPTMRPNSSLNADARTRAMAPDGTGGAFIGGEFTTVGGLSRNKIARINSNGELHSGYCPALGGAADNVYVVHVHDGKLYAGGAVTNFVNHPNDIDRGTFDIINVPDELALNPNVNNVVRPYTNFQANGAVYAMVDVGDGVIIGGAFTSVSGYTRNRIAKVLYSGEVDPFWNPGDVGVGNGAVYALYWDGSYIYVGGSFTLIGGVSRTRIASLDASGNVSSDWEVLDINTGEPISGAGGVNGNVYTFTANPASGLYVGGAFSIIYGPYDTYAEIPITAYDAALISAGGTPVSLGLLSSDTDGFVSKIIVEVTKAYPDGNERVYLAGRIERSGRRGLLRLIYDGIAFTLDPAWITSWGAENTETYDIEFSYNNHETEGEKYYLYATGEQTGNLTLNGVAYPRDRIARFVWSDAVNDYVMDTSWYPTLNGKCFKIRKNPDTYAQLSSYVYLMGTFTTINSVSVKNLARINEFTGVVDSSLETRSRLRLGTVTDTSGGVTSGDFLITTANDMFIGCTDTTPLVANHICKFDIATGLLDLDWKPTLGGTYPYCNAISIGGAPGGPLYLYAGGVFSSATNIDGTSSTAAFKFCKWNLSTGQVTSLSINTTDSDEFRVWSLACDDEHVYVGTTISFTSLASGPRRLGRYSHNATTWDSSWSMQWGAAGSQWEFGVSSVIIDEDNDCVYASGNFASTVAPALDGKVRQYIARFNRTTRSADDWYPVVNGYISGMWLDKPNNRIYMIGNFTSVNGVPRNNLAWVSTLGTGNQPEDVGQWGCSITSINGYFYDKIMIQNNQAWVGTLNTSATSEVSYRMARFHPTSGRIDYTWLMNDVGVPGVSGQTVLKYFVDSDDDHVYSGGAFTWGADSSFSRVDKTTAIQDTTWRPFNGANSNQYASNYSTLTAMIRNNDVLVGGDDPVNFRTQTSLIRVNLDGSIASPLSLVNYNANDKNILLRRGKYLYVVGTGALNSESTSGIVNNVAKINVVTGEITQIGSISTIGSIYSAAIVGNKIIIGGTASTAPFTSPVQSHSGTTNHRLLFVKFTDVPASGDDLLQTDETPIT
jgi:hypothetical protein